MLHIVIVLLVAVVILSAVVGLYLAYNYGAFRGGLIEVLILHFTNKWYRDMLHRLSSGSRMLDVGSGITGIESMSFLTGSPLVTTLAVVVNLILVNKLGMVCIEPDIAKFKTAVQTMRRAGLRKDIVVHNKSIFDASLPQVFTRDSRFDAVCFSTPLMSLPDPAAALRVANSLLKDGGVVFIPQVVSSPPSITFKILSPILRFFRIATIEEVTKAVQQADMEIVADLPAVGVDGKKPRAARVLSLQRVTCPTSQLKGDAPSNSNVRSRKPK